jgi:HEAT repeat protein/putative zinc finger protein
MECEVAQAHLADHLARTLPRAVAAEVAAHLRECETCAAEYEAMGETWQLLRTIPAAEPDSASMRTRFETGLRDYMLEHQPRKSERRGLWYYGLQFAAAAALVVLGVLIGRQAAPAPSSDAQIALLRDELRQTREMVAVSLLQQQSATERLKGVSWSGQIDQPGMSLTTALLDALMHDENANVRLKTIDVLKRFAEREGVRRGTLEALPREQSPMVQMALIDFAVETNSREAADALRRLASDPMANEAVRRRATLGLKQLGITV